MTWCCMVSRCFAGERPVGTITSAARSPSLECGIAMARLAIEKSENGTELEIGQMDGRFKRLSAKVVDHSVRGSLPAVVRAC